MAPSIPSSPVPLGTIRLKRLKIGALVRTERAPRQARDALGLPIGPSIAPPRRADRRRDGLTNQTTPAAIPTRHRPAAPPRPQDLHKLKSINQLTTPLLHGRGHAPAAPDQKIDWAVRNPAKPVRRSLGNGERKFGPL